MDKLQIFQSALKDALKATEAAMNKEEFITAFKEVVNFVKKAESNLLARIDKEIAKVRDGKDGRDGVDGERGAKGDRGERGPQGIPGFAVFGARGSDGKDGRDGKDAPIETPEQVRDKLESLEGDERLSSSAIKGLEDEIKTLRKEIATKTGGVRRVFQPYVDDFSAQTNGSLKTFVLSREPLKTNTILVWGTDFPVLLRPNTDFTVSGKTLTLTSSVPAPNTGATLIAHYFA